MGKGLVIETVATCSKHQRFRVCCNLPDQTTGHLV